MVNGAELIAYAKQFIGVPYVWGGSNPSGFDCSGLVQYVYNHFGIRLSRTTKTQINEGRPVGRNELQLGDLVFPSNGHVTLYVGDGKVLHAPQPGERVKISNLWSFWQARRILSNYQPESNPSSQPQSKPKIPIGDFTLHTGTCLHKTGNSFEFLVGDFNRNGKADVYCISKSGTSSKTTEVHVMNGENNYQNFLLQTGTALHETNENWQFCLGDYNRDGHLDLYCIAKRNTGSHSTEVHILSGKDNFQSFLLHTGTKLHETDIMQTGTGLHETGENWDFCVSGKNLCCISKRNTGSKTTEIHILNGNNNFQNFVVQTGTKLHETGDDFAFYAYRDTLFAFSKQGPSNSTEVHCLRTQF